MAVNVTDQERDFLNATIERGGRLSELRLMFPNSLDALEYYGEYMASRFATAEGAGCVCCGRTESTREEAHTWEALIDTAGTALRTLLASALGIFGQHLIFNFYKISFTTHHVFCRKCSNVAACKRLLSLALYYIFFALFFVSLVCAVPLAVFSVAMLFLAGDIALQMFLYWLLAMAPLFLSVCGFAYTRRLSVPEALRHIGRFPFKIKRVRKAHQRCAEVSIRLGQAAITK
jgi:hypothetical protein